MADEAYNILMIAVLTVSNNYTRHCSLQGSIYPQYLIKNTLQKKI